MLACAFLRSGRRREEAVAYFCCGVLHENAGKLSKALQSYRRMLHAAEAAEDDATQMIAHNSLGVNLHNMGKYVLAAVHHARQLDLADEAGKFSAYINRGLTQVTL